MPDTHVFEAQSLQIYFRGITGSWKTLATSHQNWFYSFEAEVFNLLNTAKSRRKCNSLLLSSFWLFSLKIHATLFAFFDTFGCLSFLLAFVKQRNSEKIPPTSQYFVVSFVIRKKSPNLYHEGFWTPPVHRGRSLPSGAAACVPLVRTVPNGKGLGSSFC